MKRIPIILALFLACSCAKSIDLTTETFSSEIGCPAKSDSDFGLSEIAVIGNKLPNPLALENVKQAFSQLQASTRSSFTEKDITATHHYIAFTPSCMDELYELYKLDESIVITSAYPLDYEVSDGLIVPDERFVTNGYSFRWAYVPVDYDLSQINCPYIFYYDIFSFDERSESKSVLRLPDSLIDSLEIKSYSLCGINLEPVISNKASEVHPSGTIKFEDKDSLILRGVNGLSIRSVRGTHSSYTHCNESGYFYSNDSFKYSFRYEIHFSRTDFVIREGESTDEIILKYSDYHGPINKNFTNDAKCFYALISRAAIAYYYGEVCGLRRPPKDSDGNAARLAIQACLDSDPGNLGFFYINHRFILSDRPKLNVYRQGSSGNLSHQDIYATTIHELAHASHWRNNHSRYEDTQRIVKESFAQGVERILTRLEYPSYEPLYYWRQSYTGIVQDLIDGFGIKWSYTSATWSGDDLVYHSAYKEYCDSVTGYTPMQIELAVRKSKTWSAWKNNLVGDNPGVADELKVYEAFDYWNSYE